MTGNKILLLLATCLAVVAAAMLLWPDDRRAAGEPVASSQPAVYVGAAACAGCHSAATTAWQNSQHARAMQPATEATVQGDFNDATFTHSGVTSTFFRSDDRFMVRTDGPDGLHAEFEVHSTFGLEPLQQYLLPLPGGRLQALGIAWDSRPETAGGQRWFHLYPEEQLRAGDRLHWTGIDQNWNHQCADCHSTNLRKGYDAATDQFNTTFSEPGVACEACHGPGSNHISWAGKADGWEQLATSKGLVVALNERREVQWHGNAHTGTARRSSPRTSNHELETCARCHSRRGQFSEDWQPGTPAGDAFRLTLLTPELYYTDGQQRDEVFTYGSFLQSRMHAQGVTCADCHEPHSGKLQADGNAVCTQCHAPARFDVPTHTHHAEQSPGSQCTACHMPTTTYMLVDPRHDHSFRIPRPDRSVTLNVPNACNNCHEDQSASWAAAAAAEWYGPPKAGLQDFAEIFHAVDRGAPGSASALSHLVSDLNWPAIVRASAIFRLRDAPQLQSLPALTLAMKDPDPTVRATAAQSLATLDPARRSQQLTPLLSDPVRLVRMEAARQLAGAAENQLSPESQHHFTAALDEYIAAQEFNSDRPEAQAALAALHADRGDSIAAAAAYRRALDIDSAYTPATVNLADLLRAQGSDSDGIILLRNAIERSPQDASLHHAMGLALYRQQQVDDAVAALKQATIIAPADARFAYVYGVSLHDTGQTAASIRVLEQSLAQHPYNRDLLYALALYQRAAGNLPAASQHAAVLLELEPDNPDFAKLYSW